MRPECYGIALFAAAAAGKLVTATVSGAANALSAYAIAENDGSTAVVLVNKDAAQAIVAAVDFGRAVPNASASVVELRGPSLTATDGVTLAGQPIGKDGSWNATLPTVQVNGTIGKVGLAPASAVLVRTR